MRKTVSLPERASSGAARQAAVAERPTEHDDDDPDLLAGTPGALRLVAPDEARRVLWGIPIPAGPVSVSAVAAGMLLAFGALFPMSALTAGVLLTAGRKPFELGTGGGGFLGGTAFVFSVFCAYLWGGFAAGRMSKPAGALNGALVPLFTVFITCGVIASASALGDGARFNLPFSQDRVPIDYRFFTTMGFGLAFMTFAGMVGGGVLGGLVGGRGRSGPAAPAAERPEGARQRRDRVRERPQQRPVDGTRDLSRSSAARDRGGRRDPAPRPERPARAARDDRGPRERSLGSDRDASGRSYDRSYDRRAGATRDARAGRGGAESRRAPRRNGRSRRRRIA